MAIESDNIKIIENEIYTKTTIITTEDKSAFTIDVRNYEYGNIIILALYDESRLCDISIQQYIGKTLEYFSSENYDLVKVFGWKNMSSLQPLFSIPNCKYAIEEDEHTVVVDAYVEPTATPGLTEGKHCSVCGKVLVKQNVIAFQGGCIVSFDSQGGTDVQSQVVASGKKATQPMAPTKQGYVFEDWYYENTKWVFVGYVVTEDMTLKANWIPASDTNYTVNYYLENLTKDGYTLKETKNYTGTTNSTIYAPTIDYPGFSTPMKQSVTIKADGSSSIDYYYTRNEYTITYITNGGNDLEVGTFLYEEPLDNISIPQKENMTFAGWYKDINLSILFDGNTMPSENMILYAYWQEETKPYAFYYSSGSSITISGYSSTETKIRIPTHIGGVPVETIKAKAFKDDKLTDVAIPNTVKFIGEGAFAGCNNLQNMQLPFIGESPTTDNSYKKVFGFIFGYTSSTSSSVPDGYTTRQLIINSSYSSTTYVYYFYAIPNSMKSVEVTGSYEVPEYAFANCKNFETIILPNGIENISGSSFAGCSSLKNIIIPETVETIEGNAFSYCTSLSDIIISGNVKSIGRYAFMDCSNLKTIYIGDKCTYIADDAFYGCSSAKIYLGATSIPTGFSYDWNVYNTYFILLEIVI